VDPWAEFTVSVVLMGAHTVLDQADRLGSRVRGNELVIVPVFVIGRRLLLTVNPDREPPMGGENPDILSMVLLICSLVFFNKASAGVSPVNTQ
jgi:hypothetical protein